MGEGFQFIDIIFFAAIAGFILLRLRGVLGRRTGHQRPPPGQQSRPDEANVVRLADREAAEDIAAEPEAAAPADEPDDGDSAVAAGIAQIQAADNGFDRQGFLEGALGAFEIIIEAFAEGDRDRLGDLLDDDVYRPFTRAIDDREQAGHNHQTTLVSIDETELIEAGMNGRTAFATVRLVTQQINVTRDTDDNVIDGDPSYVATVTDLWTFERDTRSRSPNWKLVATRSPN